MMGEVSQGKRREEVSQSRTDPRTFDAHLQDLASLLLCSGHSTSFTPHFKLRTFAPVVPTGEYNLSIRCMRKLLWRRCIAM